MCHCQVQQYKVDKNATAVVVDSVPRGNWNEQKRATVKQRNCSSSHYTLTINTAYVIVYFLLNEFSIMSFQVY